MFDDLRRTGQEDDLAEIEHAVSLHAGGGLEVDDGLCGFRSESPVCRQDAGGAITQRDQTFLELAHVGAA